VAGELSCDGGAAWGCQRRRRFGPVQRIGRRQFVPFDIAGVPVGNFCCQPARDGEHGRFDRFELPKQLVIAKPAVVRCYGSWMRILIGVWVPAICLSALRPRCRAFLMPPASPVAARDDAAHEEIPATKVGGVPSPLQRAPIAEVIGPPPRDHNSLAIPRSLSSQSIVQSFVARRHFSRYAEHLSNQACPVPTTANGVFPCSMPKSCLRCL
jgi:hypothetical protein